MNYKLLRAFSRQLINQLPKILNLYKIQLFSRNAKVKGFAKHGYIILKEYIPKESIKKALVKEGLQNILRDDERSRDERQRYEGKAIELLFSKRINDGSELSKSILQIILAIIGNKALVYERGVITLPRKKLTTNSMMPHHDAKFQRLKIFLWLSPKSKRRHPFFYLDKSHKKIRFWINHEDTRFPKIKRDEMVEVYPDTGDLIIFDTNGIHSHFKKKGLSRSVFRINLDPFYSKKHLNYLINQLNASLCNISKISLRISSINNG